jgi:hypothetical protein
VRIKDVAVLALLGVLAVASVYKLFQRSPKAHGPSGIASETGKDARGTDAQLNRLEQQVAGLQQQLTRQQWLASHSAASPVAAAPDASAAPPPAPPDEAADLARQQAEMDRVVADFEAESRDANWSRDITAAFQAQLDQQALLKGALQSLDCRASLCRLEMLDDRSPAFQTQLNRMALGLARQLPSMAGQRLTRADGTPIFVYFFSKNS